MTLRPLFALLAATTALTAAPLHAEPGDPDNNPSLRLQLAEVTLYAETGRLDDAYALLDQLKAQYPNSSQVRMAEADLDIRVGNRGAAFASLHDAMMLDPANEDILNRQRQAILAQGPYVSGGYNFRHTEAADEHISRLTGQAAVTSSLSAGLDIEDDHMHTRVPVTRLNGAATSFSGDRQQATASLARMSDNGDEAAGFVYGGQQTVGAGAQYQWSDRHGSTIIHGDLRKPDWDYVETVIEDGTKDDVHIERRQVFTTHFSGTLGGGYNRYNLSDLNNAADSWGWNLNLAYTHPLTFTAKPSDNDLMLGAYYTVDAEYFQHVDRRTDVNGNLFKPLPASTYEIHAVNFSASKNLSSQVYAEAYGGYGIDRIGGTKGPLYGGAIEYSPYKHLGIELRGFRALLGGVRIQQREEQIGLNVKWKW